MRFAPFNEPLILCSLQELFNISAAGDIEKGKVSNIKTDIFCYPIIGNALTNGGLYGYTDSWKQNNSITVTGRGEIGIAVERPYKYYPIVRLLTLKPKDKSDLKYFECLINSHRILNESTGVPQLTTPQIGKQKYYIVAYEEQKVIGDLFRKIDERIETQNKIIEEMRSLRKAIYFNSIKTVALKELIVSDICEIGRGRVINQQEIAKQKVPKYPVFSSQTLNNGIMGYLDNYDFDGEYITWTTDGANAGTVFYHNGRFNCTNVCGTLKVKNEKVLPYYLYIALSHVAKKHVSKNLGNPKLMNGVMKKIVIKIPDSLNQNKIVNCLKTYDKLIKNEENLLECYKKQKQYFLDNMFI